MKKVLVFIALCSMWSVAMYGQSTLNEGKTVVGFNAGQACVVSTITLTSYDNVLYMPLHFNAFRSLSKNFALSGLLLFRSEKDYEFLTHEFGFAVGPCYTTNYLNGLAIDCKAGFAFALGHDYSYNDYTRADILIQPEVTYFLPFSGKFTMMVGLGVQSLVKITESPRRENTGWDWDNNGKLSHYFLPVLNISIGFKL